MYGFGGNFLAGLLIGGALALLAPLAATDLAAGSAALRTENALRIENISTQIKFDSQVVNRAAKSDRLNVTPKKQDAENVKPAKIPIGCDPAFSPLSKGAPNFSARCLAESAFGERGIVVAALVRP